MVKKSDGAVKPPPGFSNLTEDRETVNVNLAPSSSATSNDFPALASNPQASATIPSEAYSRAARRYDDTMNDESKTLKEMKKLKIGRGRDKLNLANVFDYKI